MLSEGKQDSAADASSEIESQRTYGPGVGWSEDRNIRHCLENRGTIPAVEISVDIIRQD